MKQLIKCSLVGFLLTGFACGSSSDSSDPEAADAGPNDPSIDAGNVVLECDLPEPTCPASPIAIAGSGYDVAEIPVPWTYCAEDDISFGDYIYLDVPTGLTGLGLTIEHGAVKTGFARVEVGTKVLVNPDAFGKPPFQHDPLSSAANTLVMPINDQTSPTAGCMAILPLAKGDQAGQSGTLHVASRAGEPPLGVIDLDFVVVDGTDVLEDELNDALDVMADLYDAGNAPAVGDVQLLTTSVVPSTINFEGANVEKLRSLGNGRRMTVFFISDVLDAAGTLGWAAGIPGPNGIGGTVGSGVIIAVDGHALQDGSIDTTTMGETIAHEIGHQLGLFHTTESNGMAHDVASDTPECTLASDSDNDGSLTAEECISIDGTHMMFWSAGPPQTIISPIQSDVLFFSPITR